jgi:hypothetical protein
MNLSNALIAAPSLRSFYNGAGEVDPSKLTALLAGRKPDTLIGWFTNRANCPKSPSVRDLAVCDSLSAQLGGRDRLLVAALSPHVEHEGSCVTTGYRFFEWRARGLQSFPITGTTPTTSSVGVAGAGGSGGGEGARVRPVPLAVRNLGTSLGRGQYTGETDFLQGGVGGGFMERQAKEAAAQVAALEGEYKRVMEEVGKKAAAVRDAEGKAAAAAAELRARREAAAERRVAEMGAGGGARG